MWKSSAKLLGDVEKWRKLTYVKKQKTRLIVHKSQKQKDLHILY